MGYSLLDTEGHLVATVRGHVMPPGGGPRVLIVGDAQRVFLRVNRSSYYREFTREVIADSEVKSPEAFTPRQRKYYDRGARSNGK